MLWLQTFWTASRPQLRSGHSRFGQCLDPEFSHEPCTSMHFDIDNLKTCWRPATSSQRFHFLCPVLEAWAQGQCAPLSEVLTLGARVFVPFWGSPFSHSACLRRPRCGNILKQVRSTEPFSFHTSLRATCGPLAQERPVLLAHESIVAPMPRANALFQGVGRPHETDIVRLQHLNPCTSGQGACTRFRFCAAHCGRRWFRSTALMDN